METRVNKHGPDKLATTVFFSDDSGFGVASVIVTGKTDAVVIDTQWTLSNAYRVVAAILETGKHLKAIYVTHAHPDHYFGLAPIAEAFPDAKVYALPDVADMINRQFFGKIEHWIEVIGEANCPKKSVNIEPLTENCIYLEGERIEIIPHVIGDMNNNSMVWIPSIKTLYASDILFNQAHPFTCEDTPEELKGWLDVVDGLKSYNADVIIPGHEKVGMAFDYSAIDFTHDYLVATEEELALCKQGDVGKFYYDMTQRFPEAGLFISNEMNANVFFGGRSWQWKDE